MGHSIFAGVAISVSVTSCLLAALLVGIAGGICFHKQNKKVVTTSQEQSGTNSEAAESQMESPEYAEEKDNNMTMKQNVAYEQVQL